MRKRIYETNAERQRAYRARLKTEGPSTPTPEPHPVRRPSRPKRLLMLQEMATELATEYQNWLDRLPSNLGESETAAGLALTIEQLEDVAETIAAIDPPRVGR